MAYRILIVDDESALQNMVKEILTQAGYETTSALTCAQTLEQFRAAAPDAVLLDVNLPDGDGFSLLGKLRENRDVPVLFLSARDEDADRLQGLGLGADDYITKPFLPQELLLRLHGPLVGYENTLMVHIRRLREKIEADPSRPKYLLTVRGLGYRLSREGTK